MRKFTLLLENKYETTYLISANIELKVSAENEGEAGYMADSILGGIEQQINFSIINIEQYEEKDTDLIKESYSFHSWIEKDGYLQREFKFENINEIIKFMRSLLDLCLKEKYHPVYQVNEHSIIIKLRTLDVKKVTELDHKMAVLIDGIKNNEIYK